MNQTAVIGPLHLEHVLQLPCDTFAVFHGNGGGLGVRRPRKIDGDAQQSTGGTLDFHQVVTQPPHGIVYCLLQRH